eukprot:6196029-Pleurochrysis_carterae.AAC.2
MRCCIPCLSRLLPTCACLLSGAVQMREDVSPCLQQRSASTSASALQPAQAYPLKTSTRSQADCSAV